MGYVLVSISIELTTRQGLSMECVGYGEEDASGSCIVAGRLRCSSVLRSRLWHTVNYLFRCYYGAKTDVY